MRAAIIASLVLWSAAAPAFAARVRVDFGGTVVEVSGTSSGSVVADPEGAIGGSIHVGTPFSGYMIFDDSAPPEDVYPGDDLTPPFTNYGFAWPESALHTELGGYVTEASHANLDFPTGGFILGLVEYQAYPSEISVYAPLAEPPASPAELALVQLSLHLDGPAPGLPLSSGALREVPWNLESFPNGRLDWMWVDGDATSIVVSGTLDSLSVSPVPEPGARWALALAAAAVSARGFHRGRS
jgi:hypothetical protein